MEKKLFLIDGSSILTRQFYARASGQYKAAKTPEEKEKAYETLLQTSDGKYYTNGVYGFIEFLIKLIQQQKPTHLMVAWDVSRNTFRKELYTGYKGQRGETPKPLKDQFALIKKVLPFIGVQCMESQKYEADDYIGSMAKRFENEMDHTYILTGDRDALQLISDKTNVLLYHPKAKDWYKDEGTTNIRENVPYGSFRYTVERFKKHYELEPIQLIDLKGMEGDTSDNIPGIKGVGPKTAVALLQKYETLENIYNTLESTPEDEWKKYLKEELGINKSPINSLKAKSEEDVVLGKEAAFLSKKLATIVTDIPEVKESKIEDFEMNINQENLRKTCIRLEFESLL